MLTVIDTSLTIHYTLTDSAGKVLDSSEGPDNAEPLSYLHGAGMIVPGLEAELAGKSEGDHVKVTIDPEGGYGRAAGGPGPEAPARPVPRGRDRIGMRFRAHGPHGAQVLTVTAADHDTVTVDGNHPLAGATLNFDVKVLAVREPTEEDMHGFGHNCSSCHGCGEH